ncbi:hypothetical protein CH333_08295 [candidate division WOR-3 bacterium JGI_Cruoil_03_44_89]|mgnify:CR=1 FL=1|uniref:Secretion system C-terminal sorting domain-containing protein n=1 Tax=candidate division WOR-3 bacterium JGI_Cruoil_03_44_89 TaxID=1973748 RepID=A0A235BQ39_UNCW3|nr:MAG: hypothetical protein CH333_08295 [candidate division WOR-3 bacterium JGI_Cruoil_03_44_89]
MITMLTILSLTSFTLHSGDIESFLNSNHTYRLHQYDGRIYCATSGGVAIFDTSTGSFDRISTGDGLVGNDVRDIIRDKWGNFWFICHGKGISILSPNESWKELSGEWYGLPEGVLCINILSDTVLIGTDDGLRLWDIGDVNPMDKTEKMRTISSHPGNFVNRIEYFRDSLWICTNEGVGIVPLSHIGNASVWNNITEIDSVNAVELSGDTLWMASSEGIAYITGGDYHYLASFDSKDVSLWNERLWLATSGGLKVWNGSGFTSTPITQDSRYLLPLSGLWTGTWGSGIAEYTPDTVVYFMPDGPGENKFGDIAIDGEGSLWCITGSKMVSKFDAVDEEWKVFNQNNEWNIVGVLSALAVAGNGTVWMGTWNSTNEGPGLIRLHQDGTLDTLIRLQGNNVISDIAVDDHNDVWVSTWLLAGESSLLYRFRDGSINSYDIFSFPPGINRITFDGEGNTWVGRTYLAGGGVYRIIDESWAEELACPDIQGEEIYSLAFDVDGRLWIGTDRGTYIIRDAQIERILTHSDAGVVGDKAHDILTDIYGNVWLLLGSIFGITEGGVTRVTREFHFTSITPSCGLVSNAIASVDKSDRLAYDLTRGWLWIATDEGISRYKTGLVFPRTISSIQVFPNPYLVHEHPDITFLSGDLTGGSISIYSLSGQLVKVFSDISGNAVRWYKPDVASGVYLYIAVSKDGDKKVGKFSVIQ